MSAKDISFKQVPRQKLAETVSQQLLEAVRDKEPGTQLPSERALVEQLGVGRSTVREALKGLAMIGVIEIRHGQGVFVASHQASVPGAMGFESVEAAKLVEARNIVEPELARLAAARRTEADVEALDEILTAHRKALEEGTPPLLEASRFHIHLAEAAHNPVLSAVVQPFFRLALEKGPKLYELEPEYEEWELQQHMRIFEAVRDQNPALALERTREHVGSMGQHYEADIKRQAE
ncbi:MAG TPA: FCD domain-containing protein [Solirubrobacterales bacterium]|nr:FCD domain-containing protein [Solirubrobacterales bacterium]